MKRTCVFGAIALGGCGSLEGPPEEQVPGGHVTVLLGDGDGTFEIMQSTPVHGDGRSLVLQDFTSDGELDIVVGGGGVVALVGTGTGAFSLPSSFQHPSSRVMDTTTADFNNDGQYEIAASGWRSISILAGTLASGFSVQSELTSRGGQRVLALDFDSDGDMDLATPAFDGIELFTGDGGGNFAPPVLLRTARGPWDLITADLNNDARPDLITANPEISLFEFAGNTVSVVLSDGDGSFMDHTDYVVASGPHHVAACDINGDQATDVLTSSYDGVTVLLGTQSGTLAQHQLVPIWGYQWPLVCSDFNDDGFADVAVGVAGTPARVVVLLADSSGSLHESFEIFVPEHPVSLAVADVNHDGSKDLITAGSPSWSIW